MLQGSSGKKKELHERLAQDGAIVWGVSRRELWVLQELVSLHDSMAFLPSHLLDSLLAHLQLRPVDASVAIISHPLIPGCARQHLVSVTLCKSNRGEMT